MTISTRTSDHTKLIKWTNFNSEGKQAQHLYLAMVLTRLSLQLTKFHLKYRNHKLLSASHHIYIHKCYIKNYLKQKSSSNKANK